MPIYTKKGDKGETGLPGSRRLPKKELIFEFLGTLDETNAALGLAISFMRPPQTEAPELAMVLMKIQSSLLAIGACVAAEQPSQAKILVKLDQMTEGLEKLIDKWDRQLPELKNFILPGGKPAAAALHQTRTLIRRAERAFHRLATAEELAPIARYINRLSDFFYQAARFYNFANNQPESIWKIDQT